MLTIRAWRLWFFFTVLSHWRRCRGQPRTSVSGFSCNMRFSYSSHMSKASVCNSAWIILQRWSYLVIDGKMIQLLSCTEAALPMVCISSYRRHPDYAASRQLCLFRMRQCSCRRLHFSVLHRSLMNGQMLYQSDSHFFHARLIMLSQHNTEPLSLGYMLAFLWV